MTDTIIVTQPEFEKARHIFQKRPDLHIVSVPQDEHSLADAVRSESCRAVIVGVHPYRGPLYETLGETGGPAGAIIARFGVGHDSIDKALARQHGIVVTNTPGALDASVAEHTMWLIGSLARHVPACHGAMAADRWQPRTGNELRGQTLAVLGFGAIGRRVAAVARFGFGMRVVAADKFDNRGMERRLGRTMDQIERDFGLDAYTTDVERLFREAYFLSVHLPAGKETENFVNAPRLALMKPSGYLINTARGIVVDENALYDALASGSLAGAALDVFKQEPYQPQSPERDLRRLPNVVLTPHIGSNTVAANEAMARTALKNATDFLLGRFDALNRVTARENGSSTNG